MGLLYLFLAVLLHELGHYTVARCYGLRPRQVAIFFNPRFSLLQFRCAGTSWSVGWLPIGGYTDVPGFRFLPRRQQYDIACAGVAVNLIVVVADLFFDIPFQFLAINLLLALISLLPWQPYDGAIIWKGRKPDNYYILTLDLPEEQRELFNYWMRGRTRPTIEAEGIYKYDCAFRSDYLHWLHHVYRPGHRVPPTDDSSPIVHR